MREISSPNEGQEDRPATIPTHSEDGVDLTLIRWMLSLTPAERLQVLQGHVDSILELRQMRFEGDEPAT